MKSTIAKRFYIGKPVIRERHLVRIGGVALMFLALTVNFARGQSAVRLQPLVNDAVAQLKISYRHDVPEQRLRYEQLSKAVAAWHAAARSEENNRRLEAWLRSAIRNSMPGSYAALPPVPEFASVPIVPPVTTPTTVTAPPASAHEITPPMTEIKPRPTTAKTAGAAEDQEPASDEKPIDKAFGNPFLDDPEPTK